MSYWLFLILGAVLIGVDLTVISIYLTLIGLALIETGALVASGWPTEPAEQIGVVAILSLLNFFILQKPLKKLLRKDNEKITTFEAGEMGRIEISGENLIRVHYHGTTWPIENLSGLEGLSHGEEVIVTKINQNKATVQKLKSDASDS